MRLGAAYLLGEHDFSAFRAAECQSITPWKTMYRIDITQEGNLIVFTFEANAFLHHMIRNIVGSLVFVGKGSHSPEWMADGLYLSKIFYDPKWGLPQRKEVFP